MTEPFIYRINKAMQLLGLSRSTIYRLAKAGKLIKVQLGANSCGITSDSICSLLQRGVTG